MSTMNFSVIIPCRNAAKYIGKAVQSVLDQSIQPCEIIVVDDGSTDDSVLVAKGLDPDIKVLHSNWRNGAGTRNVGIAAAVGDWIAFLDADDFWYPDLLERASNLLEGSDDVGYINWFDSFSNADSEKIISRKVFFDISESTNGLSHTRFIENFARQSWFNMTGCVVKRERLLAIGQLDAEQLRRHDIDMWLRLIHEHTWSFDVVPCSAVQIDTPGSISRNIPDAAYFAFRAIWKNRELLGSRSAKSLIENYGQSALTRAIVDGSATDVERAFRVVYPEMSFKNRCLFSVAKRIPKLFSLVIRRRRQHNLEK